MTWTEFQRRSMSRVRRPFVSIAASALVAAAACATPVADGTAPYEVGAATAQGWFDSRSEWTLYAERSGVIRDLQRIAPPPECVNIVNGTGRSRESFNALRGRHVQLEGEQVRFKDLTDPPGPGGELRHHRFWNQEWVLNSCLKAFVFVARSIRPSGR